MFSMGSKISNRSAGKKKQTWPSLSKLSTGRGQAAHSAGRAESGPRRQVSGYTVANARMTDLVECTPRQSPTLVPKEPWWATGKSQKGRVPVPTEAPRSSGKFKQFRMNNIETVLLFIAATLRETFQSMHLPKIKVGQLAILAFSPWWNISWRNMIVSL